MAHQQTQQPIQMGQIQQIPAGQQVIVVQAGGAAMPPPPVFKGVNVEDFGIASNDSDSCHCCQPCNDTSFCCCCKGFFYVPSDYRNPSQKYAREEKCCSSDWTLPDAMIYDRRVRIEANSGKYCCGLFECTADVAVLDYETKAILGTATTLDKPCCCPCIRTYPDSQARDPNGKPVGETIVDNSCCNLFCFCFDWCCPAGCSFCTFLCGCCCCCSERVLPHRSLYHPGTDGKSRISGFDIRDRTGCLSCLFPRRYGIGIPASPAQETMRWPMVALTHLLGMKYNIAQ